ELISSHIPSRNGNDSISIYRPVLLADKSRCLIASQLFNSFFSTLGFINLQPKMMGNDLETKRGH
ncbi:hypothetical protein, partial [Agrobacterium vitis]|uniref:hypothetical protein n=1 Tax=Agrobacterium vitis TaxID=373 RepID=UPI001AEDE061